MAQITQLGALNTAALVVPDLYVQIASPGALVLNGVATNKIGIVGAASWGPANQPVVLGSLAQYNAAFGPVLSRSYDIGTMVACAQLQNASSFVAVRVTDGTDVAASYAVLYAASAYPMLLSALHTGSLGNQISVMLAAGSKAGTWRLTLAMPGLPTEVFDNVVYTAGQEAVFWAALVSAVNNGIGPTRGPSALCIATVGSAGATVPTAISNQTLLGGTDGYAGVTGQTLVGADGLVRTGLYALRGQGCSLGILTDCASPVWSAAVAFGLSEGVYMILTDAPGTPAAATIAARQANGIDSYAVKVLAGDWLYWYDQANAQTRLVNPAGFVAGCLAALSPEQSSLNKALYGILGSQKSGLAASGQATAYSRAELSMLFAAGIDVVCNPAPGGFYWAVRCGHNSSSNGVIDGDAYTRMTNFIVDTLAAGMGGYVGSVINTTLLSNIRATLLAYLQALVAQGILGSVDGSTPYAVKCDAQNNPQSRQALGYVQADVQVRYQGINEKFIVNLQGGASVTISTASGLGA